MKQRCLLSWRCLKMENYCMRCPKSAPDSALKHRHTYKDTHKPPIAALRPLAQEVV